MVPCDQHRVYNKDQNQRELAHAAIGEQSRTLGREEALGGKAIHQTSEEFGEMLERSTGGLRFRVGELK